MNVGSWPPPWPRSCKLACPGSCCPAVTAHYARGRGSADPIPAWPRVLRGDRLAEFDATVTGDPTGRSVTAEQARERLMSSGRVAEQAVAAWRTAHSHPSGLMAGYLGEQDNQQPAPTAPVAPTDRSGTPGPGADSAEGAGPGVPSRPHSPARRPRGSAPRRYRAASAGCCRRPRPTSHGAVAAGSPGGSNQA